VTFHGDHDFVSRSFSRPALHALVDECGLRVVAEVANRIGACAVTTPR
jgi:hypothetical protein